MSRSRPGPRQPRLHPRQMSSHTMRRGRESTVDHRAWTSAQVRSRKRLTALVGVLLFLAAFSASSNVLWAGCPGGDRRVATTSTSGEGPPGGGRKSGAKQEAGRMERRRPPHEAEAVASGAGKREGGYRVRRRRYGLGKARGGLARRSSREAGDETQGSGHESTCPSAGTGERGRRRRRGRQRGRRGARARLLGAARPDRHCGVLRHGLVRDVVPSGPVRHARLPSRGHGARTYAAAALAIRLHHRPISAQLGASGPEPVRSNGYYRKELAAYMLRGGAPADWRRIDRGQGRSDVSLEGVLRRDKI